MPTNVKSAAPKVRKPRAAKPAPSQDQIRFRAYEIFLRRGGAPGNPFEDWIQAERELAQPVKRSSRSTSKKAA